MDVVAIDILDKNHQPMMLCGRRVVRIKGLDWRSAVRSWQPCVALVRGGLQGLVVAAATGCVERWSASPWKALVWQLRRGLVRNILVRNALQRSCRVRQPCCVLQSLVEYSPGADWQSFLVLGVRFWDGAVKQENPWRLDFQLRESPDRVRRDEQRQSCWG
jgi:hypothetical protein